MELANSPNTTTLPHRPRKKRPSQPTNPLQRGIYNFHLSRAAASDSFTPPSQPNPATNPSTLPKRYTVYPPLLLLPANFLTHPSIAAVPSSSLPDLYSSILHSFPPVHLTHIALQAPIPASSPLPDPHPHDTKPTASPYPLPTSPNLNTTRLPTNLLPLHGPWPSSPPSPSPPSPLPLALPSSTPTPPSNGAPEAEAEAEAEAEELWVSTTQPPGITQVWAPRHTMFSRGNVREKARIGEGRMPGLNASTNEEGEMRPRARTAVLDLYVGIGYFAFSYLRAGAGRVWGWEVNGWSVEGLRRGCARNGVGCEVVRVREEGGIGCIEGEGGVEGLVERVRRREGEGGKGGRVVVVFWGDNRWAGKVMGEVRRAWRRRGRDEEGGDDDYGWMGIRHVNLGLLPTSRAAWRDAVEVLTAEGDWLGGSGWAHAHENVEEKGVEARKEEIVGIFKRLCDEKRQGIWAARCGHVERVKTFAPGVLHCVFDIEIRPIETGISS